MSDHAKNVGETVILKTCNINHSSPLQKNIFENCKRCRHTRAQKKGTRFVGSSFMYIHLSAAFLEQELKTYILFPPLPHSWSSKIHIFTNSGHESNDLSIWNQPVQPLRRQWGHIHTLLKYLPEKVCQQIIQSFLNLHGWLKGFPPQQEGSYQSKLEGLESQVDRDHRRQMKSKIENNVSGAQGIL